MALQAIFLGTSYKSPSTHTYTKNGKISAEKLVFSGSKNHSSTDHVYRPRADRKASKKIPKSFKNLPTTTKITKIPRSWSKPAFQRSEQKGKNGGRTTNKSETEKGGGVEKALLSLLPRLAGNGIHPNGTP